MRTTPDMNLSVSIITVCLNSSRTIRDTLDSVKNQTWNHIEHVIIDGGSSDGTQEIVGAYMDSVASFLSEPDDGLYDAMNKGISRSTGDVLFFLNSDDVLCDSEVIADVARAFLEHPETDLLYGNVIYRYPDRMEQRRFNHISRKNILYENLCHQAVFARRDMFRRFGNFDTDYQLGADYDWLLKVFFSGSVTRYADRDIAYFDACGRHADDRDFRMKERLNIKLKHIGWVAYKYGETIYRIRRKWRRILSGRRG